MAQENQSVKAEPMEENKPKKGKAPRIRPWKGLKTWKAASVDTERPFYSLEDIEDLADFLHAAIDHALEDLASEQNQVGEKTDYRREITIQAMRWGGKSK
jgi:hypothetical protein